MGDIYPEEIKTAIHTKACPWQYKCSSTGEWVNTLWYIHISEYYSVKGMNYWYIIQHESVSKDYAMWYKLDLNGYVLYVSI